MTAWYNEIDPQAAAWLRELIRRGLIAPGEVDERDIRDIRPDDLRSFTQCHFFAGIGVWSYALRRAGWPDDQSVWTGSCPCQPFSSAGKGNGFDDERHLWPAFHWLIEQYRPDVIFGEQVASKDGLAWLDLVQADLEGTGYASGAIDFCAAGVGAPHIRQRLYWVAHDDDDRRQAGLRRRPIQAERDAEYGCGPDGLVDSQQQGLERYARHGDDRCEPGRLHTIADGPIAATSAARWLADDDDRSLSRQRRPLDTRRNNRSDAIEGAGPSSGRMSDSRRPGPTNGLWEDADWLFCRDGKWRPVEPSTFPLAHGAPARVGRLRGYGNAINAEAATAFVEAYLEAVA